MRQIDFLKHKMLNMLHTGLLIGGMLALAAVIGWAVGGESGVKWAVVFGAMMFLFVPRVSPQRLMRFYHARPIQPIEAPQLYRVAQTLARNANLEWTPQLYLVPSHLVNAFTVGTGGDAVIGLTQPLLQRLSSRELAAVLAHEVSHIRNNDMWVLGLGDVIRRSTQVFSTVGRFLFLINFPFIWFGLVSFSWSAILVLLAAPLLADLLLLALSRTREFDADLGAVNLTGDPGGLISALRKLEFYQASLLQQLFIPGRRVPEPGLLRSHPPTEERIRRLGLLGNTTGMRYGTPW